MLLIYVNSGGEERDAVRGGRAEARGAGFCVGDRRDGCQGVVFEAVGTGAAGYQGIVTCCGRRVQLWKPGFIFHGARVTEGTCLQAWMARWYLGVMA